MSDERIEATRRIAAPASEVWKLVSHPEGHVRIDGSGMLEATSDSKPLTAVGDIFEMDMDRQPLGDTAMSKYKVRNWVTRIEPGHLIEWSGNLIDQPEPFGHIYGWRIDVVSDNECIVANYTEWSALPDDLKVYWPIVPLTMLEKSVENLERIVTTA